MAKKQRDPARMALLKALREEYKPETAEDVQNMLKDLLGDTLQGMLEEELSEELGYEKYEHSENRTNSRNGHSPKKVNSSYGEIELNIPRDRNGEYEPIIVPKHQRDISDVEQKVISMYAKGMTTRDISSHLDEIYGMEASAELISKITDRVLPEAKAWQNRPLEKKYVVIYLDAIHYHVKQDNQVIKKAVYIAIGMRIDGNKEVIGLYIGGNESAKYWVSVLNDIKSRGCEDIFIACVDGLSGFNDAIRAVYPQTDIQRCIIHQIRSSTKFVASKDMKRFMSDLKKIYKANTQDEAFEELQNFDNLWGKKYPTCIKSWKENWNELTTFFNYPVEIRKIIYTTNMIENFNRQLRKVTKTRTVFPTDDSLFKLLYLAMRDITKKWYGKTPNWGMILSQLLIQFPDRLKYEDL